MWSDAPVSSNLRVEVCMFISNFAAHSAVALEADPHQIRSDEPGSRLRPFPGALPPRRSQWTAGARRSPTAFVTAVKVSNDRMRESRFSSCNISLPNRRYGCAPPLRAAFAQVTRTIHPESPLRFPRARFWTRYVRFRLGAHSKEVFHDTSTAGVRKPAQNCSSGSRVNIGLLNFHT
jgi:hypothetical protein